MRRCLVVMAVATAGLVVTLPGEARAERACQCRDLPALENDLFQQEYLQVRFREYDGSDPLGAYTGSVDDVLRNIRAKFDCFQQLGPVPTYDDAFAACLKTVKQSQAGKPATGGGQASEVPAETDVGSSACKIKLNLPGGKKVDHNPANEKTWRDRAGGPCKAVNDFLLAHERAHQQVCKSTWGAGKQLDYNKGDFFAADDSRAYGAGIKNLRKSISDLARSCGWEGSSAATRKSKDKETQDVPVVPTPERARELAKALASRSKGGQR
jgi:hypothetical protein